MAARDVTGDGRVDLLVSGATGAVANPLVFDGTSLTVLDHFLSRNPTLRRRGFGS